MSLADSLSFPHVNGELFKERLAFADFNRAMRDALLKCTEFDWSAISPAIFGSLFQGVMDPVERRQTGGHYTRKTRRGATQLLGSRPNQVPNDNPGAAK